MLPLLFLLSLQAFPGHGLPTSETPSNQSSCALDSYTVIPNNGSGVWPYRQYRSSGATPPNFDITQNDEPLAPGLIFMTPTDTATTFGVNQMRALIMKSDGDLVWASEEGSTSNHRMQTLNNESVVSYWVGGGAAADNGMQGHGYGSVEILDATYKRLYTVCPKIDIYFPPGKEVPDCVSDVHESYITDRNTILVTSYNTTTADLTSVGGPKNGWVNDPLAAEIDIETNEPLWIWSPLAHVPINSTQVPLGTQGTNSSTPFDWFHTNSIQSFGEGYLINSRHTWTSYFVGRNGSIMWEINGYDGGDFGFNPQANFSWEHHARLHHTNQSNQLLLTMFDDADFSPYIPVQNASRGLGLYLDFPASKDKVPTIQFNIKDSEQPVDSYAEGSYHIQPDGNHFLGYGSRPFIKEFGPGGDIRWTAQFGFNNNNNSASSYRAFKSEWHATPRTPLDLVVEKAGANDGLSGCAGSSEWRGYVSWNGTTDTTHYAIYAGGQENSLQKAAVVPKMGYETEFVVPSNAKFVQVAALEDSEQTECGKSAVVAVE